MASSKTEKSKPQDLTLYTDGFIVTKGQLGWGFTVKQGLSTILEDTSAYTVSDCNLTMEVEASSHIIMPSAGLPQEVAVLSLIHI